MVASYFAPLQHAKEGAASPDKDVADEKLVFSG